MATDTEYQINFRKQHLEEALKVTPLASQTRSRAPGNIGPADTSQDFPLFSTYAKGPFVYERLDGQMFLDCFGANAAIPLGHAHPEVVDAVTRALRAGSLPSLPSYCEERVSREFIKVCAPWAEQVRWVKTGTEAVMAAVRIARAHTGRDRIVVMDTSYHGWSDLNDARHAQTGQKNGVPMAVAELTTVLPYGKPIDMDLSEVAAVIIEPYRWAETDPNWLIGVINKAHQDGALVIMDEMVYGLRWAKGGGSEFYGVQPDLACYGKALGGGVPVALVCGKADVMEQAKYVSGTYFGETMGLAAASAVLNIYQERDVIGELWRLGRLTWYGFREACRFPEHAKLEGFPVHWRLSMPSRAELDVALVAAAKERVLFSWASNNASAAMSDIEAYDAGLVIGRAANHAIEESF